MKVWIAFLIVGLLILGIIIWLIILQLTKDGNTNEEKLQATHCLVACDLNPAYYPFWPLVKRAWRNIAKLIPVLILVAHEIPEEFRSDQANIILFAPLEGIPTSLQAQCIRLLYPALIETNGGAVIISDIDLIPLEEKSYKQTVSKFNPSAFVAFRGAAGAVSDAEYPMFFNAAQPSVWGSVFGISCVADIRSRLGQWFTECGGRWTTDQRSLRKKLDSWPQRKKNLKLLTDAESGFFLMDREHTVERRGDELWWDEKKVTPSQTFSCYHLPRPYQKHSELIEFVYEYYVSPEKCR